MTSQSSSYSFNINEVIPGTDVPRSFTYPKWQSTFDEILIEHEAQYRNNTQPSNDLNTASSSTVGVGDNDQKAEMNSEVMTSQPSSFPYDINEVIPGTNILRSFAREPEWQSVFDDILINHEAQHRNDAQPKDLTNNASSTSTAGVGDDDQKVEMNSEGKKDIKDSK